MSIRAASRASKGTTHGEMEVAKLFPPRFGPRGTYSHAWMSRADQSFTTTAPKTCSANSSGGDGIAHLRGSSDDESHLGFDVEAPGRSEVRAFLIGCLPLSAGTNDVGAGDDDGARAPVVSDGKMLPVRHQGGAASGRNNRPRLVA